MSIEGIFEEDGSVGTGLSFEDLVSDAVAGDYITVVMTSNVTGDLKVSGSALITDITWSAPVNDVATFSANLQGSGTLTVATV
jgi:predicted secreted protein